MTNPLDEDLRFQQNLAPLGIEEPRNQVLSLLTTNTPPRIVSIEGLGGIGKTTLAEAVMQEPALKTHYVATAWVSAKQQDFIPSVGLEVAQRPALDVNRLTTELLKQFGKDALLDRSTQEKEQALADLLKQRPYLIVIDNLETVIDYETLLPTLHKLADPSKFVLTSRHSLREHSGVYCLALKELNQTDTYRLIRREARARGLSALENAAETQLQSIYDVVGGNPLALKLVVGQVSLNPLSAVLENLQLAQGKEINHLYTHIYWHTWHALDSASQQVLMVMPVAEEGTAERLTRLAQLEPAELSQALLKLVLLSLVQVGGTFEERRYTIHRLTESFLLNEATEWSGDDQRPDH